MRHLHRSPEDVDGRMSVRHLSDCSSPAASLSGSRSHGSQTQHEMEDDMEILALLGEFFVGIGVLLLGVGVIWFVSMYKEKHE